MPDGLNPSSSALTRRGLLRDTAAAVALTAMPLGLAPPPAPARRRRGRVAVLGGGVAGLTVAHELVERGFEVSVFETRTLGGKARSFGVPHTARGGRRPLPGEHGMRFFAGFYQNVPDTMRRIPFGSNRHGVFDNLIPAPTSRYSRWGGRSDFSIEYAPDTRPWTLAAVREHLTGWLELTTYMPKHEVAYFVERLIVFMSSCDERRFGEWEHRSWWRFVAADRFSEEYRRVLVNSVTRFLLAARPRESGARSIGQLWEASLYNEMRRGSNGYFDRILDGPTNEAWINPWVHLLRRRGVRFHRAHVTALRLRRGRIAAAEVRTARGRHAVHADWFVCAVPVEKARQLFDRELLDADPRLRRLGRLVTRWQNGLQFYVREETQLSHGHVLYEDSPWGLSSISQAQFWGGPDTFARRYGSGKVRDCISVDISDFDAPGIVYGKPARALTREQIARDCWAQMKAHVNDTGRRELHDALIVSWHLDPALSFRRGGHGIARNDDPLLISTAGAWANRPQAVTAVPNLFLAADYVRVGIDTATMEGANNAGRLAANGILAATGSSARVPVFGLYQPPEWEPFRRADAKRYRAGLPNAFDTEPPPALPGGGP